MDDYALVLNAGSSSLKFCVYRRPEPASWRLEARGQIEGIGTSPRICPPRTRTANSPRSTRSLDAAVRDGREARWTRSPRGSDRKYGGARVLGVGHRVVHGGATFAAPIVVTPEVLAELHRTDARWRRCISRTTWRRSRRSSNACRTCRRWPASTRAFIAASRRSPKLFRCRARSARQACSDTAFTACPTNTSRPSCPRSRRRSPSGRVIVAHLGSGASLCAMKNGKSVDSTLRLHGARWSLHGHEAGRRRSRRDPAISFRVSGSPPRKSRRCSTRNQGCSASPASATTCAICSGASEPAARLAVDYFVYRAAKEIGALAAVLGGIDGLVFTAGIGENSAEIRQRICEASAWLGIELDAGS